MLGWVLRRQKEEKKRERLDKRFLKEGNFIQEGEAKVNDDWWKGSSCPEDLPSTRVKTIPNGTRVTVVWDSKPEIGTVIGFDTKSKFYSVTFDSDGITVEDIKKREMTLVEQQ